MRFATGAVTLVAVLATGRGLAVGLATADEHVYVRAGDPVEWAVQPAPLPEVAFGAYAARLVRPPADAPAAAADRG